MSDPFVRTVIYYALSILGGALVAGLAVLATQLAGPGDVILWKPILAAMIGPIISGIAASRLPRPEGAELAAQIDALKTQGVKRGDMVVVAPPKEA